MEVRLFFITNNIHEVVNNKKGNKPERNRSEQEVKVTGTYLAYRRYGSVVEVALPNGEGTIGGTVNTSQLGHFPLPSK